MQTFTQPRLEGLAILMCAFTQPRLEGLAILMCAFTQPRLEGLAILMCAFTQPRLEGLAILMCAFTHARAFAFVHDRCFLPRFPATATTTRHFAPPQQQQNPAGATGGLRTPPRAGKAGQAVVARAITSSCAVA
jgi:hypothetical protein